MRCDHEKNLSAYFDNELSDSLNIQIENHLESCTKCKERLQLFRNIQTYTQPLQEVSAPYYLSSKTINLIKEPIREKAFLSTVTSFAQRSYFRFGVFSGLVVFVMLIGLFYFKYLDSSKMYQSISLVKQKDLSIFESSQKQSDINIDRGLLGYLLSSDKLDFEGEAPLRDLAMLYDYERVENRKVFDTITFYFDNSKKPTLESHFEW